MIGEFIVGSLNYPGSILTIVVVLLVGLGIGNEEKGRRPDSSRP